MRAVFQTITISGNSIINQCIIIDGKTVDIDCTSDFIKLQAYFKEIGYEVVIIKIE